MSNPKLIFVIRVITIILFVISIIISINTMKIVNDTTEILQYKSSQERLLAEYLYETESTFFHNKPVEITNFSNLQEPVFLRYEYVSPEVISEYIVDEDDICVVDKISVFSIEGDTIIIQYSGPKASITGRFNRTVDMRGVFTGDQIRPTDLFINSIVCFPF